MALATIDAIERGDHEHALELLETNMSLTYRRLRQEGVPLPTL